MSHTIRRLTRGTLVALLVGGTSGAAQSAPPDSAPPQPAPTRRHRLGPATAAGEPRFQAGLSFSAGQPLGAFRDHVNDVFGVGAHALYRADREGAFALRLDGGFLNYGNETLHLPLSDRPGGGRVRLDVTTTNNVFWLGAGPQLMAPRGTVRPYVNATAGFSYFATISSAKGRADVTSFADDANYSDTPFSWGGGAGVLVPLRRRARSLAFLDVGARYHNNGRDVRYLREGGIRDLPGGDIAFDPIRSRADLVSWHVGLSVGAR